jgi:hypothetical protein
MRSSMSKSSSSRASIARIASSLPAPADKTAIERDHTMFRRAHFVYDGGMLTQKR